MRGFGPVSRSHSDHDIHSNPQPACFDPRRRWVQDRRMQPAMRSIVDIYVRRGNRKALNDLKASRERLIVGLKTLGGPYDPSKVVAQLEGDIALIEAGLAKLDNVAAA
jgi:hypothetical protein